MSAPFTVTDVASRPILFSGPMVRAILAGKKTQTRRTVKPAPDWMHPQRCCVETPEGWQGPLGWDWAHEGDRSDGDLRRCPYGSPGDLLWVRETFAHQPAEYEWTVSCSHPSVPAQTWYRADFEDGESHNATMPWKPSIHMPRRLSRIDLAVTNVRVQRLQEISEADCAAEGWEKQPWRCADPEVHRDAARDWYMDLWDTINGAGSWRTNPWVWVVTFKRRDA